MLTYLMLELIRIGFYSILFLHLLLFSLTTLTPVEADAEAASDAAATTTIENITANGTDKEECDNDTAIIQKLFHNGTYNKYRLPNSNGVDVSVDIWVQEITSVSEISSDFEVDIYINELWLDPMLRFDQYNPCKDTIALTHEMFGNIWTPNSCFINSKSASIHDSPFRNIFLMIYRNGTVWANYRVKVKGPCDMNLAKFPMDEQSCLLIYESFSYNNQEVAMHWRPYNTVLQLKNFTLPDFELPVDGIVTTEKPVPYPAGVWNELYIKFHFKRRCVWYVLQAYIPTYLTIFISWISFTLGSKAIPARTMLGVNSLLAMIMMFGNIMRNLPRVSYVKAIDVWMLACMTFNFCSLIELAIVGYLTKDGPAHENKRKASSENSKLCKHIHSQYPPHVARYIFDEQKKSSCMKNCYNVTCPIWTADKIDTLSCFLFPALFSVFNICYWAVYLSPW